MQSEYVAPVPDFPGTGPDTGVDVIAARQERERARMAGVTATGTEPELEAYDNSEARRVIALEAALRVSPVGSSTTEIINAAVDLYNYVKDGAVPSQGEGSSGPQEGAGDASEGPVPS